MLIKKLKRQGFLFIFITFQLFLIVILVGILIQDRVFISDRGEFKSNSYRSYQSVEAEAKPIQNPQVIKNVEGQLTVQRDLAILEDGTVHISASVDGLASLEEGILIEDLVESIKFPQRVDVLSSELELGHGFLFPGANFQDAMASTYGPGAVDEKKTKLEIVVLDLNLNRETTKNKLYDFYFKLDVPIDELEELVFDSMELRNGKYILSLNGDEFKL